MALIGQAVSEEKNYEHCGRRRTLEHGYTISSPCEPEGSGELKQAKLVLIVSVPGHKLIAFIFNFVKDDRTYEACSETIETHALKPAIFGVGI